MKSLLRVTLNMFKVQCFISAYFYSNGLLLLAVFSMLFFIVDFFIKTVAIPVDNFLKSLNLAQIIIYYDSLSDHLVHSRPPQKRGYKVAKRLITKCLYTIHKSMINYLYNTYICQMVVKMVANDIKSLYKTPRQKRS